MKTLRLTASGRTGKEWVKHLEKNEYRIGSYAKELILSDEFAAARGKKGTEYEIAIVPGKELYESYDTTASIKEKAAAKGWTIPTPEIALLVREALSDDEMKELGVWYVAALHDPIAGSGGDPGVLGAYRGGGGRWVGADWGYPLDEWDTAGAFALVVPGKSSALDPQPDLGTSALRGEPDEHLFLASAIATVKTAGYQVAKIL